MYIEEMEYNPLNMDLCIKATATPMDGNKILYVYRDRAMRPGNYCAGVAVNTDAFASLLRGCKEDLMKRVIFAPPATIVFWRDGTKTIVKCENEPFDAEKGIAMAVAKKMLTSKDYNRLLDTAFDYKESVCIDNSHHTRKRRRKHGKRA